MKVWNAANPQSLELHLILNHRVLQGIVPDELSLEASKGPQAPQNLSQMKWLTKSDLGLKAQDGGDLLQDVLCHADMDVPEVTQVCFPTKICTLHLTFLASFSACNQA